MNPFHKRTAGRIAAVSILLAVLASPLAGLIARHNAEQAIISLAWEESDRLLQRYGPFNLNEPQAVQSANVAAQTILGGMFDMVDVYDARGQHIASADTPEGRAVQPQLPPHGKFDYTQAFYRSTRLDGGVWVLQVFLPLRNATRDMHLPITGYVELVRVMPQWQKDQVLNATLVAALVVGLAALLCGAAIYPVVIHLSVDNEHKAQEVLTTHIAMMEALGRAIAKRDSETGAHNYRVAWIASRIAEPMGISGTEMQALIAGSFLHDVGKIGIPDAILLKPGRLDEAEMTIMRSHVQLGKEIMAGTGWMDGAQAVVASHHEHWDGNGYPDHLRGAAIPLAGRIFAVADVFDALTSRRPYKGPLSFEDTMDIMVRDTGSHFDPAVMAVFAPMAREIHDQLASCDEADTRRLLQAQVQRYLNQ
jgi:HD-GYP domain-containing protein (c-di-GMP phosphodiesterase class II)